MSLCYEESPKGTQIFVSVMQRRSKKPVDTCARLMGWRGTVWGGEREVGWVPGLCQEMLRTVSPELSIPATGG